MSEKKFNMVIDLNPLALTILREDVSRVYELNQNQKNNDVLTFLEELEKISQSDSTNEVVDKLANLFNELVTSDDLQKAGMIQQFLLRQKYLDQTILDYQDYSKDFKATLLDNYNLAMIFNSVFVPFFDKQINVYDGDMLNKLNMSQLKAWDETFYHDLKHLIKQNIMTDAFVDKLSQLEELIVFLNKINEIYQVLEASEGEIQDKEVFFASLSEYRIVLQTIDILIVKILEKLKKVIKTTNE